MLKTALTFLLLTTAPAMALDQAFLGTWAPDAASCAYAGSTVRFTVTPKKLEGRETACTLKRASRAGSGWRMQYSCVGEGDNYSLDLKWRLDASGHLLEQAQGKTKEYMSCVEAKAVDAGATATAADDFVGNYAGRQGSYKWTASITPAGRQAYNISIKVDSTMPACSGATKEFGRLQAGRIVTQPDQGNSCVLTVSRNGGGIEVVEKNCSQDHGMACDFSSRMKRVGQ